MPRSSSASRPRARLASRRARRRRRRSEQRTAWVQARAVTTATRDRRHWHCRKREYAAYSYDTLFKPGAAGGGAAATGGGAQSGGGRGRGGGRGGAGGGRGGKAGGGGGPAVFEEGAGTHFGADDEADLMGLGGGAEATKDATAAKAFEESFM